MMRRWGAGFLVILAPVLSGCRASHVAFAPIDNVDFAVIRELKQIDGIYSNTSDKTVHHSGDAYLVESLTTILWRSAIVAAVTVEVRALGENRLSIQSRDREGTVVKEQVFMAGRDFEFVDGRLRFRKGNVLLQDGKDELFGPDVTTIELGIDRRGELKVRTTLTGAGLVVVLPVAVRQTMEYRFPRLRD